MAKLILLILFSLNGFALEKPKDLLKAMADMQAFLNARKPAQIDEVAPKYPEIMHLLGWAVEAKDIEKAKRVHAIVQLSAATIPFDRGENTAADVLAEDYGRADLQPLYDKELELVADEPSRNRLAIGLHQMSENFKSFKTESR